MCTLFEYGEGEERAGGVKHLNVKCLLICYFQLKFKFVLKLFACRGGDRDGVWSDAGRGVKHLNFS